MYNILTYARVVPVTADVQIILKVMQLIGSTLRTETLYRVAWTKSNNGWTYNSQNSQLILARKQLYFILVVPEQTKED